MGSNNITFHLEIEISLHLCSHANLNCKRFTSSRCFNNKTILLQCVSACFRAHILEGQSGTLTARLRQILAGIISVKVICLCVKDDKAGSHRLLVEKRKMIWAEPMPFFKISRLPAIEVISVKAGLHTTFSVMQAASSYFYELRPPESSRFFYFCKILLFCFHMFVWPSFY